MNISADQREAAKYSSPQFKPVVDGKMSDEALFDENNNSAVDLNSVKLLEYGTRDDISDSSNVSEAGSNNTYSVSTASFPPDDPDRVPDKLLELLPGEEAVPKLRCKVKKLEAEVDSLKSQLSRINIRDDSAGGIIDGPEDRTKQEREKCVVLKCIPQAHVANGLITTRVSEFFKISSDEITVQVTDQLNKWCVVVLQTPSRLHATTILRKFGEFRKLYHCYHRTQALPCFSNAERQRYQQLWAEAIERNNRAGYRNWEVDAQELRLVETVGVPQKWRVKVHYYPENDSPLASTSAIEVRRRQRGLHSPKGVEKASSTVSSEDLQPPKQKNNNGKLNKQIRGEKKRLTNGRSNRNTKKQQYNSPGYEYIDCISHAYVPHHHYVPSHLGQFQNPYYVPNHIYNSMQFYSQHLPLDVTSSASATVPVTSTTASTTTSAGNVYIITPNGLSKPSTTA